MHSFRNNIQLEGNLGKDAEFKTTASGDVVNFTLAVNEQWIDKKNVVHKHTDWFDVEVWGPKTKNAATLKKGEAILLDGKVRTGTHPSKSSKEQHKTWTITANLIRRIDYNNQPAETISDANEDAE